MMGATGSGTNSSLRIQTACLILAGCDENKHHRMLGIHLIVLDSAGGHVLERRSVSLHLHPHLFY